MRRRWSALAWLGGMRVAAVVALAATVTFTDNFDRANSTDLGTTWSTAGTSGPLQIVGNEVRAQAVDASADEYVNTPSFSAQQWARVRVSTWPAAGVNFAGAAVLYGTGSNQGYVFYAKAADDTVALYDSAAGTDITTPAAQVVSAGDLLTIVTRTFGSTRFVSGYLNSGILAGQLDSTTSTGQPGVFVWADAAVGDVEVDDFSAGDVPVLIVSAGTEGSAASGSVTAGAPSSAAVRQLWIAACHVSDTNAVSASSEWTQIVQGNGGGTTSRLALFWHRYTGTTPSLTFSHTGGQSPICGVMAFATAKDGYEVRVSGSSAVLGGTDASIEANTVTATQDLTLQLTCFGAADDNCMTNTDVLWLLEDSGAGTQGAYVTTAGTPDGMVGCAAWDMMSGGSGGGGPTMNASDPWASAVVQLVAAPMSAPGALLMNPWMGR